MKSVIAKGVLRKGGGGENGTAGKYLHRDIVQRAKSTEGSRRVDSRVCEKAGQAGYPWRDIVCR